MFEFTTTRIINSNKDYTTGLPVWSAQEEAGDKPASLNIKRSLKFLKPNVVAIYKAAGTQPTLAKATIDLSSITQASGVFRIAMYIRLQNSQNSYYANDMVFKGKPLYIEFEKKQGEATATLANKVAKIANKYIAMSHDFKIVSVTASDTKVIIEAADQYQRFIACNIEWYNPEGGMQFCCNTEGAYEVIAKALPADDPEYDSVNTIVQGVEGFGTYEWLLHNFRLPTAANTRWLALNQDEVPVVGGLYNQYTIVYRVHRGIMGSDAVGDDVTSVTNHVFYVLNSLATEFEGALATIGFSGNGGLTGNGTVAQNSEAIADLKSELSELKESVETLTTTVASKADTSALAGKQDTLTAGDGIDIASNTVTVKLDGASLTKSAAGLKVTE